MSEMMSKQELRAEETRQAILRAAGDLFAAYGYEQVTMRQIAKEAGCSHTTIYLYFKDKETLLYQLALGPLQALHQEFVTVLARTDLSPEAKLSQISLNFVRFCLQNRTMYTIFFMVKAERVDQEKVELAINQIRNQLFARLREALLACLPGVSEEMALGYARIFFYTLHGMVGTYHYSGEPTEQIMSRLQTTFQLAVEVLLLGAKETIKREANKGEG